MFLREGGRGGDDGGDDGVMRWHAATALHWSDSAEAGSWEARARWFVTSTSWTRMGFRDDSCGGGLAWPLSPVSRKVI